MSNRASEELIGLLLYVLEELLDSSSVVTLESESSPARVLIFVEGEGFPDFQQWPHRELNTA